MQATWGLIRHRTPRAHLSWRIFSRTRALPLNAIRVQYHASSSPSRGDSRSGRDGLSPSTYEDAKQSPQTAPALGTTNQPTQSLAWMKDRRLEQRADQKDEELLEPIGESLKEATAAWSPKDVKSWERVLHDMRRKHGDDGVWEVFRFIRKRKQARIFANPEAGPLRDDVLAAAVDSDSRIAEIVELVHTLPAHEEAPWPNLYFNVVHHLLSHGFHEDAVLWHLRLAPQFPPETTAFVALLTNFATDPAPEMQTSLTTLYIFGTERRLYDHIVPALYVSGHSILARRWRKVMLELQDVPSTSKSLPFVAFIERYYPTIKLAQEEKALLSNVKRSKTLSRACENDASASDRPNGIFTDAIVAKWFASSWTSVEFAIDLVHRLGLRTIGARSLQSLALREADAEGVKTRIAQLQKLGVTVPDQLYCKAVVSLAKENNAVLLGKLLHCDIHPDEFDDIETRRMLLTVAVRDGDESMQRLLKSMEYIESITDEAIHNHPSNRLLGDELSRSGLVKARIVLGHMEALNVEVEQKVAGRILRRAYQGIEWIRKDGEDRTSDSPGDGLTAPLDRAIATTLHIARIGAAIRVREWQTLLRNLAWEHRYSEMEQLSLEIVDLYKPEKGGMLPVHQADVPDPAHLEKVYQSRESELEALGNRNRPDVKKLIPADLPFSHRQHPVCKIFDIRTQKQIVRWGFKQMSSHPPRRRPALVDMQSAEPAEFDVGRGVRLLAMMRDRGVLIDLQVLRAAVIRHIGLAQLPTRSHHKRDSYANSPEVLKGLMDQAWGSEFLPKLSVLEEKLERQEPELWKRWPVLYSKNFDEDKFEHEYQTRRHRVDDGLDNWFKKRRNLI